MPQALEGIRIVDLTRVWSGPLAVRILADLGAEIIRIESLDARGPASVPLNVAKIQGIFPEDNPGEHPWNRHALFNNFNRNKIGITLQLNTPQGVEVFKSLVKISDAVVDNYSPRVMQNFGLGYSALKNVNPSIVAISMPAYGMDGPYRDYVAYGTSIEPASGLSSLVGYQGGPPHLSGTAYPDVAAALHATAAVLTAIYYRRRTGRGQLIDLSQAESATCLIGEVILGNVMNKKIPPRMGNRHPFLAPHSCYRCRGEDKWVAIAVSSDEEWEALCKAMGNLSWITDERFSDQMSRWSNHDELDWKINQWTMQYSHYEVMQILQEVGVPAGAVLDAKDLISDPHLKERGFFWEIPHPEVGPRLYDGLPIRLSESQAKLRMPAPCLGEHNECVLGELLGLPRNIIAQLEKNKIIGTRPPE